MANKTCYAEDGTAADDDIPCGFSDIDQCCGAGWDCLGNGLCRQHGTTSYAQGSCTDPNYQNCLNFCDRTEFNGYTAVSKCGPNSWCCAGADSENNCCQGDETTSLEPFPFTTIDASLVGSISVTVTAPSSAATSTAPSTATSSITSRSSQSSSSAQEAAASAPSASSKAPVPTPTTVSNHSGGLSTGAKAGIAVAVPLVVILLAALAYFIYRSRKQGKYLADLQRKGSDSKQGYPQNYGQAASMNQVQNQNYDHGYATELGGDGRHELSNLDDMGHELPSEGRRIR